MAMMVMSYAVFNVADRIMGPINKSHLYFNQRK